VSGTVAPNLPVWAQWFAALAVPIAAVVGIVLGILNLELSRKRRRDELFDRRFQFILDFKKDLTRWENSKLHPGPYDPLASDQILRIWASKSEILFGYSVSRKILSLDLDKVIYMDEDGDPFVSNEIDKIFTKHMRLD